MVKLEDIRLESVWLGELSYDDGLRGQAMALEKAQEGQAGFILGLTHKSVVTLGKRARPEKDLLVSPLTLEDLGIELRFVDRGGEATLHGPGQLVIYPILPLTSLGVGVREYVELLEEASILTLKDYGILAHRGAREPGLYTSQGKIAFFGVRVQNGVSTHGLSLNVSNDLDLFDLIRSCGVLNESFDSLASSGINAMPSEVFKVWTGHFRHLFEDQPWARPQVPQALALTGLLN